MEIRGSERQVQPRADLTPMGVMMIGLWNWTMKSLVESGSAREHEDSTRSTLLTCELVAGYLFPW
jgi:hypothetical protein